MLTRNGCNALASMACGFPFVPVKTSGGVNTTVTLRNSNTIMDLFDFHRPIHNSPGEINPSEGSSVYGGTYLSSDDAEPTVDDYTADTSKIISSITSTFTSLALVEDADGGLTANITYTVTNTGTEPITIRSVYLFMAPWEKTYPVTQRQILIDHTKLANPITIPGGNSANTFTYAVKFNFGA